jgi:kynureninase
MAHGAGAYAGFDLAHAAGNVPLNLHEDGADFASWCSYKYLNSGPGNVSGVFIHERHGNNPDLPRFGGWWGHDEETRFLMQKGFKPMPGADGWQLSNVNVLSSAAHLASLEIFEEAGMERLREKSIILTGYFEFLIHAIGNDKVSIITPADPDERGCQLSLVINDQKGKKVFDDLSSQGIVVDWREPDVIRAAPVPLYNTFEDIYTFCSYLKNALKDV